MPRICVARQKNEQPRRRDLTGVRRRVDVFLPVDSAASAAAAVSGD